MRINRVSTVESRALDGPLKPLSIERSRRQTGSKTAIGASSIAKRSDQMRAMTANTATTMAVHLTIRTRRAGSALTNR